MTCPTCASSQGRDCPGCLNATRRALGMTPLAQFPDDQEPEPTAPETYLAWFAFAVLVIVVLLVVQPDFSPLLQCAGEFFQKGQR